MNSKEFTIKETTTFRLRVKSRQCVSPSDLFSIEFINESLGDKGEVTNQSTYNFFMTNAELKTLCEGILQ